MNYSEPSLSFLTAKDIDPLFLQSYVEHYAFINPWADAHWNRVKSGVVSISEEVAPARLFKHTEFYNDWIVPQDVEAATGVKVNGEDGELVIYNLQYPLKLADRYNRASAEVLRRTRGNLLRSIEFGRLMRRGAEAAIAGAALVERTRHAAMVVDANRGVREANQRAVDLFASGRAASLRHGKICLSDKIADEKFGEALSALSRGIPVDGSRISFRDAQTAWQVSLAALPAPPLSGSLLSLLPPHRLVLVLLTAVSGSVDVVDLSALSSAFGLTPSEISFCRRLMLGESVSEAADQLGITIETARSKLKVILQKTGTSRQGQLMLLLSKVQ